MPTINKLVGYLKDNYSLEVSIISQNDFVEILDVISYKVDWEKKDKVQKTTISGVKLLLLMI